MYKLVNVIIVILLNLFMHTAYEYVSLVL
jgi:hypothetical protein